MRREFFTRSRDFAPAFPHRNFKNFPLLVTVKCRRLPMLPPTDLGLPGGRTKG